MPGKALHRNAGTWIKYTQLLCDRARKLVETSGKWVTSMTDDGSRRQSSAK